MAKLFLFGIGGTGVRVIKSLTMLLAAGVDLPATEVVPIIVDPHQGNHDLKRTIDLLESYQAIQSKLAPRAEGFFKTKITTLQNLLSDRDRLGNAFSFQLKDVQNEQFKEYIDHGRLDERNQALVNLLFSEANLATEMDIGFIGNPNIGSVVLNQFKESDEFAHFASNFQQGDRIFIISSIFGGTGAAGFPTILKNLRNAQPPLPNHDWLRNAAVGAITLLPYFGVAPDPKSKIDKATFVAKAKAALSYYERNISGNNTINALYYLGDNLTKDYPNDPGDAGQRNDAHFIELVAALSVIDFMTLDDASLATVDGRARQPIYKEFGIRSEQDVVNFTHLSDKTQRLIERPLSQYMLFTMYLTHQLDDAANRQPWTNRRAPRIDASFLSSSFFQNHLTGFNHHFDNWILELRNNRRAFAPFNVPVDTRNLFEFINEVHPKRHWNPLQMDNFVLYDDALNRAERQVASPSVEQKFMSTFYEATRALSEKKFAAVG